MSNEASAERHLPAVEDILSTLRRKTDLLYDEAGFGRLQPQTTQDFCRCTGALGNRYMSEMNVAFELLMYDETEVPWVKAAQLGLNLQATQTLLDGLRIAKMLGSERVEPNLRTMLQQVTRSMVLLRNYLEA